MAEREQIRLVAPIVVRETTLALPFRQPTPEDLPDLAELTLSAYRGTIEDDGVTLEAATGALQGYLRGEAGQPLLDCSFVALDAEYDVPVSAALVSLWAGEPLLVDVYTGRLWKNQGLATTLIQLSMNALASQRYQTLALWMTVGNAPAERVYQKLGFHPV